MRLVLAFLIGIGVCILVGTVTLRLMRWKDDRRVAAAWSSLAAENDTARFDPASIADLPEPARRFLLHSIEPAARLARSIDLRMEGQFLPTTGADFASLVAEERVTPGRGFVWRADLVASKIEINGAETFIDGAGCRSFWRSFLPARDDSADVSRSLAGRAALESVFVPTTLLPQRGATWTAVDADRAEVALGDAGAATSVVITVAPDGRLASATCERWGNDTADRAWTKQAFTIDVDLTAPELRVSGIAVPGKFAAAWGRGDQRHEFLRATVVGAEFR